MIRRSRPSLATGILLLSTLALSGCAMFQRSEAWNVAMDAPIQGRGDPAQAEAYANGLQRALAAKGVESKVVKFRYTAVGRHGETAFERTVVIYRNETTPKCPWWLMESTLLTPMWLPNGTLEEQLRFAQPARTLEIIEERTGKKGERSDEEWRRLFARCHASPFDPNSPADRKKMAALKLGDRR